MRQIVWKRRNHPDVILSRAQITLTFVLLLAIILMVAALIFFHNQMTDRTFSLISSVITALVTLLTLSWNYFFARQRPSEIPGGPNAPAPLTTGIHVSPVDPNRPPPVAGVSPPSSGTTATGLG